MKDCASYLCDLIEAQVDHQATQHKADGGGGDSSSQSGKLAVSSDSITAPLTPPGERWAIGQTGVRRWHLFRRFGKTWNDSGELRFPNRRTSGDLLLALLEGRGSLTFRRGFEALTKKRLDPAQIEYLSQLDHLKVRGQVKAAVSYLRKDLNEAIRTHEFDLIPYDSASSSYRLLLPIGYAAEGLSETNEPTGKLSFDSIS